MQRKELVQNKSTPRDLSDEFHKRVDRVFGSLPKSESVPDERRATTVDDSSNYVRGSHIAEVKYKGRMHRVYLNRSSRGARFTPDYIKHPEKWTKYDLKEDGTEKMKGMSADQVNRAAALQFLKERKASDKPNNSDKMSPEERITFRAPNTVEDVAAGQTVCGSSAHVMPEYEFGNKRHRKRKLRSVPAAEDKTLLGQSVKLSHLEEDLSSE